MQKKEDTEKAYKSRSEIAKNVDNQKPHKTSKLSAGNVVKLLTRRRKALLN